MGAPTAEEVISMASSVLEVSDVTRELDCIRFRAGGAGVKEGFARLAGMLDERGAYCRLEGGPGGPYVSVMMLPPAGRGGLLSGPWAPRLLFAAVVALVMVDGYYRTLGTNEIADIGEPLEVAAVYTLSLLGILGVHEAGHLAAARWHGLRTTWPYFIPGIPVYGIPTFGAFIRSRGLTVNRETLFDVAIAGPVAGLAVAVVVALYGAYTAPVIPLGEAELLREQARIVEWSYGEPLLMKAALAAFGKGGHGSEVLFTPVLFAAWLGFLITFLNMLPAWQLDGGHMARTLLGGRWHRYATFASMGVLVLLGYWLMAMFILVLSARSPGVRPLDDISPLPRGRMAAYGAVVALAVLCAPLPASVLP